MAAGDDLLEDESIVRALYFPLWDPAKQRGTSRAFGQIDTSVSRLAVLEYDTIVEIYLHDLGDIVAATCTVDVATILRECAGLVDLRVRVVEDPKEATAISLANPSHAEVRARTRIAPHSTAELPRPVAKKILAAGKTVAISEDRRLAGKRPV